MTLARSSYNPRTMDLEQQKLSDRELLILLHDRQQTMGADIKEIKDDTKDKLTKLEAKVDALERHKADQSDVVKLMEQTGNLKNWLWFAFGAVAILQVALTVFLSWK